jgi:hypothetical protein
VSHYFASTVLYTRIEVEFILLKETPFIISGAALGGGGETNDAAATGSKLGGKMNTLNRKC